MNTFYSQLLAAKDCKPTHAQIAYEALKSVECYSSYGSMMHKLANEVVGYWFDIIANNGTPEDVREAVEIMDHYNEEPNADNGERILLIGELWNFETHNGSNTLDGHIDQWLANIGQCAKYAVQEYLENLDVD